MKKAPDVTGVPSFPSLLWTCRLPAWLLNFGHSNKSFFLKTVMLLSDALTLWFNILYKTAKWKAHQSMSVAVKEKLLPF